MDQNRRLIDVAEATLSLPSFVFAQLAEAKPERAEKGERRSDRAR